MVHNNVNILRTPILGRVHRARPKLKLRWYVNDIISILLCICFELFLCFTVWSDVRSKTQKWSWTHFYFESSSKFNFGRNCWANVTKSYETQLPLAQTECLLGITWNVNQDDPDSDLDCPTADKDGNWLEKKTNLNKPAIIYLVKYNISNDNNL